MHALFRIKQTILKVVSLFIFPYFLLSQGAYFPVMMGDITMMLPYSKVEVSLGADKTLGENEHQLLSPTITNPQEVQSYEWSKNGEVLSTEATFSTSNLSVGTHTLTLTITDINGIVTKDEITITIQEYMTGDDFVGATKGKFVVNQGMAGYHLDIAVPPGVAGMEPKLSLNYNSRGSNGYMGKGWSIDGVSSISRCSQTEATDGKYHKFGVKYNINDRFCLDGQRLINTKGGYGADNTEYRTEINNYSKIISRQSVNGGPKYFDVYTKSGLRYIYGSSASTYDRRSSTPTLSWKVDRIIDTYGNTIYFRYTKDNTRGRHYLTKVSYAGTDEHDIKSNTIEYVYENRDDVSIGYENGYPFTINQRLQEVIVKTGGLEIRRYKIAYEEESTGTKQSKVKSITEKVKEAELNALTFTHSSEGSNTFHAKASWSDEFGSTDWDTTKYIRTMADVNADGLIDIVGFGNAGVYVALNNGNGFDDHTKWSYEYNFSYAGGWRIGEHIRAVVDMNADGLPDLVGFANKGVYVAINTGDGFEENFKWSNDFGTIGTSPTNGWDPTKYIRTLSDANGDGLIDIVGFGKDAVYVALNNGNGFNTAGKWIHDFDYERKWRVGTHERMLSDVNGDGLDDIVGFGNYAVHVAINTGSGFLDAQKWSDDFGSSTWDNVRYMRSMADVNGDGLPDIIGFEESATYVAINTGYGFKAKEHWSGDFSAQTWNNNEHVRMLSDVNGDGLDDIVGFGNYAVHVALSDGQGFENATEWVQGFTHGLYGWRTHRHERMLPDVNGDGAVDIVGFADDGVYVGISRKKDSIVTRITNGVNQDIKIYYGDMIDNTSLYTNYTQEYGRNSKPWNHIDNDNIELSLPMKLVSSVTQIDGIGGTNTLAYQYNGYVVNKVRGYQGFYAINTFDYTNNSNSAVFYKQIRQPDGEGFQYTGMPYKTYVGDTLTPDWSNAFSKTEITYKDASSNSRLYEPYTHTNLETSYDPKYKNEIKTVKNTNTMSSYGLGNILSKVNQTYDVLGKKYFTKTIVNTYDEEDTTNWRIGRLSTSTVTHTQTDGGTVTRASSFKYNSLGLLREEIANVGTSSELKKSYVYNGDGNKIRETLVGTGISTAITTFTYSDDKKFQKSITNAANLTTKKTYNARFGTLSSMTTPDGVTTRWYYDGIGRKIRERRADGTSTAWMFKWYDGWHINTAYVHYVKQVRSGMPNSYIYYDSLGRDRSTYTTTLGNKTLFTSRKSYNKKGELFKEMLPYISGVGTHRFIETKHDPYGRVIEVGKPGPDGNKQITKTEYKNFTLTITDPKNIQKQVVKNAIGQVRETTDVYNISSLSSKISYTYDAIGNLLTTTDADGNSITMEYNARGNKTFMNDPDLGIWNYRYRADGKLEKQWSGDVEFGDSRNLTKIYYDVLGRVTNKFISDEQSTYSKYNKQYFYYSGSTGRLSKTIYRSIQDGYDYHNVTTTPRYDSLGRIIESKQTIDNKDFISKINYDAYSRPSMKTYPNGYKTFNTYKYGMLNSIKGSDGIEHYKINTIDAYGQTKEAKFGNDVRTLTNYNDAGFAKSITSAFGGYYGNADVQKIKYTYDALGNVETRYDNSIMGKQINDSFGYDSMNRLTSNTMNTNVNHATRTSTSYRYNSIGNMTYQSGIGDYRYDSDAPHALTKAGTREYTYDDVGNMTDRNGDSITYNAMSLPATIAGKNGNTVKYFYDTSKNRYLKQTDEASTYYIGKSYEEEVKGSKRKETCYITLGGKTIGTHVEEIDDTYSINTSNPHYKTTYNRYFHTDALGSITSITNDNGNVIERRSYDAFGKIRPMLYGAGGYSGRTSLVRETTRAYTGHEQIKEIEGLIHMNARVYDSEIGRFLSADTMIQAPLDSQSYNRYSYVRNNPMMYTDPTGHWFLNDWIDKGKKEWRRFEQRVSKEWDRAKNQIIGGALIVAGIGLAALGMPNAGAVVASSGVSIYEYDSNVPPSQSNQITIGIPSIPIATFGNSEQEQVENLQEESEAIEQAQAGVHTTSASPVSNDNYANGVATSSYGNNGGDMITDEYGNRVYQNESIDVKHSRQELLNSRVNYLKDNGSALNVDVQNALNYEHRYVGTPYIFGGKGTYNAGKRSSGRVDYSFMPFVQSTHIDGLSVLTREHRIDYLILHESNHYGSIRGEGTYNPYTYTGTLGPRVLGVKHEDDYHIKINQDFIRVHPIYAF